MRRRPPRARLPLSHRCLHSCGELQTCNSPQAGAQLCNLWDGGWLLHAGDSYFDTGEKQTQRLTAADDAWRRANQERLRELHARASDEVTVFCAHDPVEYAALSGRPVG